ncbi:MAG TPA: DUF2931 family protein [Hymenobacter sp.]|jgi:hypothetical protein|uniref:DUF2931 family protein n=1 Tax=Hymenobacter sp. TaxID=1898978 RepID=UPI002ED9648B
MLRLPFLIACLLATLLLPACRQSTPDTPAVNPPTDLFEIAAGPAVPDGYPATIYRGNFVLPSGDILPVPSGQLLTGSWGASGTGMPGGLVPAPDSLELLWFSYADDKFYEGHFLLPQQRMQALLRTGFWDTRTQQHATYTQLTVCLLPTGGVALWLSGGNKVLVGRYQATETSFDFGLFNPGTTRTELVLEVRAQMPPEAQARVAASTVSAKPWDGYLTKYSWKLAFRHPVQLYDYGVDYFSAERTNYPDAPDPRGADQDLNHTPFRKQLLSAEAKAVPRELYLFVRGQYGRKRQLRIDPFDEAETLRAFQTLHAKYPQEPLTLYVDHDERLTQATVALQAGGEFIPLVKSTVQFFDVK